MSETTEIEWKDPETHRKPKWPLAGYAPGNYMGRCVRCEGRFLGMDKRATNCLPCAIDVANECIETQRIAVRDLKAENETLRSAIQIVSPLPVKPERTLK